MKPKQLFVGLVIILLATTLLFPQTEEKKYCNQYSGESNRDNPSDNFISCKTDIRCKVEEDTFVSKEADPDEIVFMCVPDAEVSSATTIQKTSEFPK